MQPSKKQLIWSSVIIVIGVIIFFVATNNKGSVQPNTTTIKRGDVIQEVSVTGRIKPTTAIDLAFEKGGRVTDVFVNVGDKISQGKLLAVVDSSVAEGNLLEAQARLAELRRGSRPEEILVKEAELSKYTQDLTNAYSGVSDILNDAYNKSDDAVHTKTSGIFSGYKNSSYKYTFSVCDSVLSNKGEQGRYDAEFALDAWRGELSSISDTTPQVDLSSSLTKADANLNFVKSFLETLNRSLTLDCTVNNTSLDTYRTNVNTARTNVATAISNVNTRKQSIATLALSVAKVENELSLMKSGSASEVVSAQEARVLSARGEFEKHKIISPISGVVTKADIEYGEGAVVGKMIFTVISDASFEIEANAPEADIAKVSIEDTARITLDAYGSDVLFDAKVVKIDPAETIIDNVPTYKVTLLFTKSDPRIKSGMTANIDIGTASRENVLFAPERSIITRGGEKFVRIVSKDGATSDISVIVGLKGSDGSIEIISGVALGDTVIMAPKD